jgi:hypothetical protein
MAHSVIKHAIRSVSAAVLTLPMLATLTGCQVELAGQTLPSPYYIDDDFQYYAKGPEFKLAREAAAMKEQAAAIESEAQVPSNRRFVR